MYNMMGRTLDHQYVLKVYVETQQTQSYPPVRWADAHLGYPDAQTSITFKRISTFPSHLPASFGTPPRSE